MEQLALQHPVILSFVYSPYTAIRRLNEKPRWIGAFVIVSVMTSIAGILLWSYTDLAMLTIIPPGTSQDHISQLLDQMRLSRGIGIALTPVVLWIKCAVISGLLAIFAMMFTSQVSYKKIFALVIYAQFFLSLNLLCAAIVTLLRGRELIASPRDLLTNIGWSQFLPINNLSIAAFIDSLGIFQLWYLAILAIGLVAVARCSKTQATIIVLIYWGFTAIVAVGFASLQAGPI